MAKNDIAKTIYVNSEVNEAIEFLKKKAPLGFNLSALVRNVVMREADRFGFNDNGEEESAPVEI